MPLDNAVFKSNLYFSVNMLLSQTSLICNATQVKSVTVYKPYIYDSMVRLSFSPLIARLLKLVSPQSKIYLFGNWIW